MDGPPQYVEIPEDLTGRLHHGIYGVLIVDGVHIMVDSNGDKLAVDDTFFEECFGGAKNNNEAANPLPEATP